MDTVHQGRYGSLMTTTRPLSLRRNDIAKIGRRTIILDADAARISGTGLVRIVGRDLLTHDLVDIAVADDTTTTKEN